MYRALTLPLENDIILVSTLPNKVSVCIVSVSLIEQLEVSEVEKCVRLVWRVVGGSVSVFSFYKFFFVGGLYVL